MQIIPKLCQSWARCVNTEIFSKASAACTDGAVMWSVSLIEIRKPFLADFPELLSQDSQDCTPLSLKTQRRGCWVFFGKGKNCRLIINAICTSHDARKSKALPKFLVGCGTTSAFGGKGNNPFWQA